MCNPEVRRKVLGLRIQPPEKTMNMHRLEWLGHVLFMPIERMPRLKLPFKPDSGWKTGRG